MTKAPTHERITCDDVKVGDTVGTVKARCTKVASINEGERARRLLNEAGQTIARPNRSTKMWREVTSEDAGEEPASVLAFYDHERQHYAANVPIPEAGEFMVGDYAEGDEGVGELGEFKIELVDLRGVGGGSRTDFTPRLQAFGDGSRAVMALAEICDGDLTGLLDDVADSAAFSRRLLALGLRDRSDQPLEG